MVSGGSVAISGVIPVPGSRLPMATPMKPEVPSGCLGADGWYTQQEPLGAASQQTRQAVPRRTGEAPGLHGEPRRGDQRHDQGHARHDGDAEEDCRRFGKQHDQQDQADDTAVDHPGLGRDGPCAPPRVCRRAPDRRSSSQPSAAMPTATMKAIGNSNRIGGGGNRSGNHSRHDVDRAPAVHHAKASIDRQQHASCPNGTDGLRTAGSFQGVGTHHHCREQLDCAVGQRDAEHVAAPVSAA